jgi:BTB/POZ domain
MVDPRDYRQRFAQRDTADTRRRPKLSLSSCPSIPHARGMQTDDEDAHEAASPASGSRRLQAMQADPFGTLADVTLESSAGERRIRCHRSVLCTYEYFQKAFGVDASFQETERKVLRFEGVSGPALDALVDFMYDRDTLGDCDMSVALEVWRVAHVHFFLDLVGRARSALVAKLEEMFALPSGTPSTERIAIVVEALQEATLLNDDELVVVCSRLFFTKRDRLQTADMAELLQQMSLEEMKALQSYPVVVPGFEAEWTLVALHWLYLNPDARGGFGSDLMQDICLDSVSGSALATLAESATAFRRGGSTSVFSAVDDAIMRGLQQKMRKLESELEAISHCPEAVRAADLVRRDERDKRNRCNVC